MASVDKKLETPLGRVKGLGSAKSGSHHWWAHRISAIAMIPLSFWFVISVIMQKGKSFDEINAWLSSTINATLMSLFVITLFYHMWLGLQVVIEDYVHTPSRKVTSLIAVKLIAIFLSTLALISILKIALGS